MNMKMLALVFLEVNDVAHIFDLVMAGQAVNFNGVTAVHPRDDNPLLFLFCGDEIIAPANTPIRRSFPSCSRRDKNFFDNDSLLVLRRGKHEVPGKESNSHDHRDNDDQWKVVLDVRERGTQLFLAPIGD